MKEIHALQNMANASGAGLVIHERQPTDKRRRLGRYFAQLGNITMSPVLPYAEMNCWLMGFAKAKGQA